ncbi:MAG: tetratricopeptide repeat protein [Desulfobacterales bacterium]|nr:tetratricopeptide repeat protein [Desulfobacterales bacterium]
MPFEGDTALSIAVKHKSEAPPDPRTLNAQIPEALARLVLQCLEKAPENRPAGAADLSAGLAAIESALPATVTPLPSASRPHRSRSPSGCRRRRSGSPRSLVLAAAVALLVWQFAPGGAPAQRTIAVMAFKNQTGDPAFDYLQETIPNLLITSLEQSGRFRVTTWQEMKDLLRQAGKDASAALDDEAGFEVCRRAGIETLAVGFYTKAGDVFVTDVKVLEAATKRALKTTQARGDGPASILKNQIDDISRAIRRGHGLEALKIEKAPPKIIDVTTSSLEAYRAYLRGRDEIERFFGAEAKRSLERRSPSIRNSRSPTSTWPRLYIELGDRKAQDEALEKALQFASRASEKERLYIEASYAGVVKRDGAERRRILEELVAKYPGEKDAYHELGRSYSSAKHYPQALANFERALALDPDFGGALNEAAYACLKMGEPAKAIPYLERYLGGESGGPQSSGLDRRDAHAHGPAGRLRRQIPAGPGRPSRLPSVLGEPGLCLCSPGELPGGPALPRRAGRPGPGRVGEVDVGLARAYIREFLGQWDGALRGDQGLESPGRTRRGRIRHDGHELDARVRPPRPA